MQIAMSITTASETQGSQFSGKSEVSDEDDFVLIKMNVPRRYKLAPGFPGSQGDSSHTKRALNRDLTVHISGGQDKDKMADTDGEFATVTVNLISQPKQMEVKIDSNEAKDDNDNDQEEDQPDDEVTEKEQEDEEVKDTEELEELDLEEYENESSKTKLLSSGVRSVVQETLVPLALPNIFIPCPKCSLQVNICHVRSHRDFHGALHTLKFAINYRPHCLKTLIKRRKLLIKRLLDSTGKEFTDRNLQKINTAFEILKSELEGTGNAYRVFETSLGKVNNTLINILNN